MQWNNEHTHSKFIHTFDHVYRDYSEKDNNTEKIKLLEHLHLVVINIKFWRKYATSDVKASNVH